MKLRRHHIEHTPADDHRFGIPQRLFLSFVDRHDGAAGVHHEHRVGDEVEERLVARLRRDQLLGPLRHRLLQTGRVVLEFLLQAMALGHIADERPRMHESAAFLVEQRRGVNLHVDRTAVFGH